MVTVIKNHGKVVSYITGYIVVLVSPTPSVALLPFHTFKVSVLLLFIFCCTEGATNLNITVVQPNCIHCPLHTDGLDLDLKKIV